MFGYSPALNETTPLLREGEARPSSRDTGAGVGTGVSEAAPKQNGLPPTALKDNPSLTDGNDATQTKKRLLDLPDEVLLHILRFGSAGDLVQLIQANSHLKDVARDNTIWQPIWLQGNKPPIPPNITFPQGAFYAECLLLNLAGTIAYHNREAKKAKQQLDFVRAKMIDALRFGLQVLIPVFAIDLFLSVGLILAGGFQFFPISEEMTGVSILLFNASIIFLLCASIYQSGCLKDCSDMCSALPKLSENLANHQRRLHNMSYTLNWIKELRQSYPPEHLADIRLCPEEVEAKAIEVIAQSAPR